MLMVLPVVAALSSTLTDIFNNAGWYKPIQEFIVPWEAKMVAVAIWPLGIKAVVTPNSAIGAFYMVKDGINIPVNLSWNCLGWQSMLMFGITAFLGL